MRQARRVALGGALLVAGAISVAAPAAGLEIFGIRLWGSGVDEFEIIDPLDYEVTFRVLTTDEPLERDVRAASALWRERDTPASGFAGLLNTARGDYRRILAALYNRGYYGPEISITLAGREADTLGIGDALPGPVPVVVTVASGPRFRFGIARIVNEPSWIDRDGEPLPGPESVDFVVGEPARAGAVGAASALAIERWRQLSHATAREVDREVIADHATSRVEATVVLEPGPRARFGPLTVRGSRRVDPDFIAYMTDLPLGKSFDPDDIADAQARLSRLGTFRLIRIEEAEEVGPDGLLPITVTVEDRLPRTFGVGATLSTIDGLGLEGFWLHRNLLGRAEQLRFDASISGIGTDSVPDELGYQLGVTFVRPGTIEPDTNLVASLFGRQQDFDTYRERAIGGRIGFSRVAGTFLTGDLFLEVTRSRVRDDLGIRRFLTIGPLLRVNYDRRDSTVDPTEGYFLIGEVKPFYEAEFGNTAVRGTLEARGYLGFGEERDLVLAGRARVGSYVGPSVEESPPDQLFFAGGGGSIRGYGFRSIGVESTVIDGERIVTGGRSLVETSGEVRYRINDAFGAVGFLDAGLVGGDSTLGDDSGWFLGAGAGVRYYTGFGPLRVDVAVPLDKRSQDSSVALYIGIGQAF